MTQVAECLPCKCKALSSNPSSPKKKINQEKCLPARFSAENHLLKKHINEFDDKYCLPLAPEFSSKGNILEE
jgi:hypothetical protein